LLKVSLSAMGAGLIIHLHGPDRAVRLHILSLC